MIFGAEYDKVVNIVEETISAKVVKRQVTNGYEVDVVVNYGDQSAYSSMRQAFTKIQKHIEERDKYLSDYNVYNTQDRSYELDSTDVYYFNLGKSRLREE